MMKEICTISFNQIYLRQLLYGLLNTLEMSVDDVDAVRHRVRDVLLHKAAEPGEIRRHARYSHDRTFSWKNTTLDMIEQPTI